MIYIYYALLLIGLIILLVKRYQGDDRLSIFIPLYFLSLLTESIHALTGVYFVYHIYQPLECLILCTYFYMLFTGKSYRKWVWAAFILYLCLTSLYFIRYPNQIFLFDPIDMAVEAVFIILLSLLYLIDLYRSESEIRFSKNPHFWIASANLLYYSGTSLFMGLADTLRKENATLYNELTIIAYVLNLMLYSVYIKAFLCPSQPRMSS